MLDAGQNLTDRQQPHGDTPFPCASNWTISDTIPISEPFLGHRVITNNRVKEKRVFPKIICISPFITS